MDRVSKVLGRGTLIALVGVACVVSVGAWLFARTRSGPFERLGALWGTISSGMVYGSGGTGIYFGSVKDVQLRELVPSQPQWFIPQPSNFGIVDGTLYYAIYQAKPVSDPSPSPMHIRSVELGTGFTRDITTIASSRVALVGDTVYWIKSKNDGGVARDPKRLQAVLARSDDSELWAMPLSTLAPHRVRGGLPPTTTLYPGVGAVFWTALAPAPDVDTQLGYCLNQDLVSHTCLHFTGDLKSATPLVVGDRLIWFATDSSDRSAGVDPEARADMIACCPVRGSRGAVNPSQTVLTRLDPKTGALMSGPYEYDGRIYCLTAGLSDAAQGSRNVSFCRLAIENPSTISKELELPEGATFLTFDGGYAYVRKPELQYADLWSKLTRDTMSVKSIPRLYRARLNTN